MENIEGKNYFTIKELTKRLNCSRYMIQRYVYSGKLEAIKIKARVYITENSYNALFIPKPHVKRKPK